MIRLGAEHPVYGWSLNKGYAAPEHMDALARHGACDLHRRSWRLPGVYEEGTVLIPEEVLNEGTDDLVTSYVTADQTETAVR